MKTAEYIVFCIDYQCNNNCIICMLDGVKGKLRPVSFEAFKMLLRAYEGRYAGIVFSGGEVTLNQRLPQYIAHARERGFRNVMIQTNGRALCDLRKARQLQLAGANEFFVSFHAVGQALFKNITRRSTAQAETKMALENLDRLDIKVITNTVMSALNYAILPQIARFLLKYKNIQEMQFWGYMPLSHGMRELALSYVSAEPYLNEALKLVLGRGREACVKYFPACLLLKQHARYLDNSQSDLARMDDSFWKRWDACSFKKCNACQNKHCMGLPAIYRKTTEFKTMKSRYADR